MSKNLYKCPISKKNYNICIRTILVKRSEHGNITHLHCASSSRSPKEENSGKRNMKNMSIKMKHVKLYYRVIKFVTLNFVFFYRYAEL